MKGGGGGGGGGIEVETLLDEAGSELAGAVMALLSEATSSFIDSSGGNGAGRC